MRGEGEGAASQKVSHGPLTDACCAYYSQCDGHAMVRDQKVKEWEQALHS